ncbi:MAG: CHASE3 domain-containing protein [Actinocatenispora sp.]
MRGGLVRRMVVASTLLATVLASVFAFLIYAVTVQRDAAELARNTQEELAVSNKLERLVIDMETGERGYVLTHNPSFLKPWHSSQKQIPPTGRQLTSLVHSPSQVHRTHQILQETNSYIHDYSIPVVDASRRGDQSASSVGTTLEGKARVDSLRTLFDDFAATAQRLSGPRNERAEDAANGAILGGILGAAGSAVLVVAFAIYLSRSIVRPVREGAEMAGRLAGGDLSTRMPESGIAEIGVLQHSFNTMGSSLQRSRNQLSRLAEEQAALRRVATLVAHGVPSDEVFTAVAEEIGGLLDLDGATMFRYEADGAVTVVAGWGATGMAIPVGTRVSLDGQNIPAMVLADGLTARIDDLTDVPGTLAERLRRVGVRSVAGAPITVEARTWGVMTALSTREEPLPADTASRFADFTDLAATTIANSQARADLIESRARVVAATDQTRRRIERNLHDGVQQRLVSITLDLRNVEADLPDELPALRTELSEVADELAGALDDLREVSRGIHPAILSEAGLGPAVRALARRSPLPVEVDLRLEKRLPQPIEVAAYYVVAEALTNATKYAEASAASVSAVVQDGSFRVTITDDGVGGADPQRGSGLIGLHDRVEALGGTLRVTSVAGQGTSLDVAVPLDSKG